jgi:CBS domain containing-hemolysin-like protein
VGQIGLDLLGLLAVLALILLNGFFVAAEFALVAVRKTQVEALVREGKRGAGTLQCQIEQIDRYIAATQLGITVASLALGWVGEPALANLLEPAFGWIGAHATAALIVAFLIITFLHVVLGEVVPKTIALQLPVRTALWVTFPLEAFTKATRPIVLCLNALSWWICRALGITSTSVQHMVHSVEELTMLVDEVEEAGLLSAEQADFVQNVFQLSTKTVGQCLVGREKMAALEVHTPPDAVLETVRHGAHTRLPVYDGAIDNIVGIVNTKDLFYLFSLRGVVVLEDAIYPALFLKPEQPIGDALRLFKRSHRHMALVRDEAAKILGLITLEDVLEELVGELEDEHDRPVPKIRPVARAPQRLFKPRRP